MSFGFDDIGHGLGEKLFFMGKVHGLSSSRSIGFAEDALKMKLDRLNTNIQCSGYFRVRKAIGDMAKDFTFSARKKRVWR